MIPSIPHRRRLPAPAPGDAELLAWLCDPTLTNGEARAMCPNAPAPDDEPLPAAA